MTAPPDATQLTKWEDAFQHPIPTVRVLERQLQGELAANKEKLRGLVGESYRDLLRTAERIVEMDRDAQRVESCLAETSRACSSKLLERKARNLRMFEERVGAEDREKYVFAAQLAVLGSCPGVVSRLLHKDDGANCLLATKVFVVLRLLLKSLLQKGPPVPLLESLKHQRTTLTTHLTTHIDHLLTTPTPHLTTVFASYSLLKTSSPSDVLRHFLFIRSSALATLCAEPTPSAVLAALTLYNQTLAHADAQLPKRLSDALIALKSRPLFADPALTALADLALDTNARWLPNDLAGFVPWVRHDDLERPRVVELAAAWAARELLLLHEALATALSRMAALDEIVRLRADVLALWRAGARARRPFACDDDDGSRASERFRELVGARMAEVLREKCAALADVGAKIEAELQAVDGALEDSTSLWDPHLLSIPLTAGGALFKESVQSRVHGKNTAIKAFRTHYDAFQRSIAAATSTLHALRSPPTISTTTTSTTTTAAADDDDDFDAEEQRAQEALEDSLIAETELRTSLDSAYHALSHTLSQLLPATPSAPHSIFLLRAIRQIRQHPDALLPLPWFCAALLPRLHAGVAGAVARRPLAAVDALLQRRAWSGPLASKALWEGEPPLPAQPSPLVFKFLHELVGDMHRAGDDVWTPAAVRCVKVLAGQELWAALERVLAGREIGERVVAAEAAETAGDGAEDDDGEVKGQQEEEEEEEAERRFIGMDWAVQLLFDALYLDEALQRKGANARASGISSLAGKIEAAVGIRLGFDEELRRRLEGGAREYWKRTCLLFGLLA